jgi:L-ascorbate metabolism protein UlaG (beta-lactamase superfamily)
MTMDKDLIITRMSNSSWFKLSIMGLEIHLDPGYGGLYENQGFKESDINVCDYILISHEHKDHMRSEVIEKLCGHKTKMIVSKSCEKELMFSHQVVLPNEKIML